MFMKTKLIALRDFEKRGYAIPENRGGGFYVGEHASIRAIIKNIFQEFDRQNKINGQKEFIKEWEIDGNVQKIILSEKDLLAYKAFCESSGRIDGLRDFSEFVLRYLNFSMIASLEGYETNTTIITADPTPHITFERWIRAGYNIIQYSYFDFDVKTKKFIRKQPSPEQNAADENKRIQLEKEYARSLGIESLLRTHN